LKRNGGVSIPAEYQNTTWTFTIPAGSEAFYGDKQPVKLEFRTSDFTATLADGATEVWTLEKEISPDAGYRTQGVTDTAFAYIYGITWGGDKFVAVGRHANSQRGAHSGKTAYSNVLE
jgi:hypothetical protein